MQTTEFTHKAQSYLNKLCVEITNRRTGSPGNRAATDFFAEQMRAFGFETEAPEFACIDWREEGVELTAGEARFTAFASPYSLGCRVAGPLRVISTVDELAAADLTGQIALLHGEIASHQLMPKNFPFYNPDEHRQMIALLERKAPLAIIAATTKDPELAGSLSPFPLFEDGDFDIPSVFMTDAEGTRLAACAGQSVILESRAERVPAVGCNVIARKGDTSAGKAVCCAHIDAKLNSPGAIDNAAGVITLLLLAELLADYSGQPGIEIAAINGEDYFSAPGEQQYLALNAGRFDQIVLGINIDGVGYHRGRAAYSLYDVPDEIAQQVEAGFAACPVLTAGEPWYQGDHMLFILNQRPALALTSEYVQELVTEITHTPQDEPGIIDPEKLALVAQALYDVLLNLRY